MDFNERKKERRKKLMKKRLTVLAILFTGIVIGIVIGLLSDKALVIIPDDTGRDLAVVQTDVMPDGDVVSEDSLEETQSYQQTDGSVPLSVDNGKIVVIDAGHQRVGNSQKEPIGPGASQTKAKVASGATGIVTKNPEYAVTLDVALLLKKELQENGYNVIMVRETNDVDISNAERAQIANNANADAFIRIHCNSVGDSGVVGALSMCQTPGNPYCGDLYEKSRRLSECVLNGLCEETGAKNRGVSQTDDMSGINWCRVPVTIVEMGFMSNPDEDRLMSDKDYQIKLARGMAKGIERYFL